MNTADRTVGLLLQAVHADPLDLAARAALSDACAEAGRWEDAEFWREMANEPNVVFRFHRGVWGILGSSRYFVPVCKVNNKIKGKWWTPKNAFARLRIGWDRARKDGLV